MLLSSVFLENALLLLILEILLLYMKVLVHQLKFGGVSQRVNVCPMFVCLPRKHCERRRVESEHGEREKRGMRWEGEERCRGEEQDGEGCGRNKKTKKELILIQMCKSQLTLWMCVCSSH